MHFTQSKEVVCLRPTALSSGPMDPVVQDAIAAIERRDLDSLRPLLHPYLQWKDRDGTLRGRTKVLARLAHTQGIRLPEKVELRNGQIYRWVEGT
jgi:hypothetical protein